MSDNETTISVNGGPDVPFSVVREALDAIKGKGKPGPAPIGHNTGGIAADRLRSIVERIERLTEERKGLASDIKDIFTEAKSAGFDVKVLRQLIRIRGQDPAAVDEAETILDLYKHALGMAR